MRVQVAVRHRALAAEKKSTRQQIGNFGYVNGTSTSEGLSGTTQPIGSFTHGNYVDSFPNSRFFGQWHSSLQADFRIQIRSTA